MGTTLKFTGVTARKYKRFLCHTLFKGQLYVKRISTIQLKFLFRSDF